MESGVISHLLPVIIRRCACGQKGASRYPAKGQYQARREASITGPARPARRYAVRIWGESARFTRFCPRWLMTHVGV